MLSFAFLCARFHSVLRLWLLMLLRHLLLLLLAAAGAAALLLLLLLLAPTNAILPLLLPLLLQLLLLLFLLLLGDGARNAPWVSATCQVSGFMFLVWVGGAREVETSCVLRPCLKTLVFVSFSRLCTTHCARMWSKIRCHKHACLWRPCPKHWYLQRLSQHTVQGVE